MAELIDLARRMRRVKKSLPKQLAQLTMQVADDVLSYLTTTTPVDTSLAVSNWQVQKGSPVSSSIPAHYPGVRGSTAPASRAQTLKKGRTQLRGYKSGTGIWISNLIYYIVYLENRIAMVKGAILFGRITVRKFRLDLK